MKFPTFPRPPVPDIASVFSLDDEYLQNHRYAPQVLVADVNRLMRCELRKKFAQQLRYLADDNIIVQNWHGLKTEPANCGKRPA